MRTVTPARAFPDRVFRLWEYIVSLSQLVVRSPKRGDIPRNIDLVFRSVEYVRLPAALPGLRIVPALEAEVAEVEQAVGKPVDPDRVFVLACSTGRYLVVAGHMHVEENDLEYLDSPLELPNRGLPSEPLLRVD